MANCRFEDNYTDLGIFGKINSPVLKCDPPSTNAIWGMGAMGGTSAVIEGSMGVPAWEGGGNVAAPIPRAGVVGSFGSAVVNAPKWETCNDDEVDTGLTCDKPMSCKTEEDKSQPIRGAFGEMWGYMMKTTCTQPSSRAKKQY